MSNSEVMEKIATKLDNLRTSILEGQIRAEHELLINFKQFVNMQKKTMSNSSLMMKITSIF